MASWQSFSKFSRGKRWIWNDIDKRDQNPTNPSKPILKIVNNNGSPEFQIPHEFSPFLHWIWNKKLFPNPSFSKEPLKADKGSFINHVARILGIFDPPFPTSWSLLLNKTYVIKLSFG